MTIEEFANLYFEGKAIGWFLENTNRAESGDMLRSHYHARSVLESAFIWDFTRQGHCYWENWAMKLQGQYLPGWYLLMRKTVDHDWLVVTGSCDKASLIKYRRGYNRTHKFTLTKIVQS
jgi:hypothetical protein